MWFLSKIALVGTLIFLMLQNSTQPAGKASSPKGASAGSQEQKQTVSTSSTVGPTQPVITVHGLCDVGPGKSGEAASSCSKVMTREQFEALAAALNPGGKAISATARRNLAKTYTDYLAVEAAAKKAGMEDTPQFRELMNWARLRTITDFYRHSLEEKFRNSSQDEIDAYFKEHLSDFERVTLARILVPRENPLAADKNEFDKKALEAAKSARERAGKGEEPAQIQKDTYSSLGLGAPPLTDLGKRRRPDFIASEAADVFSLKAGEASQVETEAKNYVIYKVLNKDVLPEAEVKSDISREIYQRKFRDAMKSVIDAAPAELNEQYFGTSAPAKAQ